MNEKRILETVIAGIAVFLVIEWAKSHAAANATPASYLSGSATQSQGVMA